MKKIMTVFGASVLALALACGGGGDAGMDEMDGMDEMEPSSEMESSGEMMADSMAADSMDEGMPEAMMEGEGMDDDEMGGGV